MWKKFIILGLILLIAGSAMLGWVLTEKAKEQKIVAQYKKKYGSETEDYLKQYDQWLKLPPDERTKLPFVYDKDGKTKSDAEFEKEKRERLIADMDKLAAGEMVVYPFADLFYGENWQDEVLKYKERKETNEFILTTSIVCASMGGVIVGWFLLLWSARLLMKLASTIIRIVTGVFEHFKAKNDHSDEHLTDLFSSEAKEPAVPDELIKQETVKKVLPVKSKSQTDNNDTKSSEERSQDKSEVKSKENQKKVLPIKRRLDTESPENRPESKPTENTKKHETAAPEQPAEKVHTCTEDKKVALLVPQKESLVGPRISTRRQVKNTQLSDSSKPIDSTLEELTQQVSAIREYTAFQQNRLEKLQDGYDWNIIRNFCLRIIRCIDNLEARISQLVKENIDPTALIEARDELVFALESSGIEQFKPEINSDYRGQEKFAEAIKARQNCKDSNKSGKIANIIRPGYQYVINDEMIKVVRPAQVKLYA